MRTRPILAAVAILAAAAAAQAVDGVLEINQTCATQTGCFAGDAAGFPVTITTGGSYRLTGNLTSSVGTAVQISQNDVTLDLGGFSIAGTDLPGSIGIFCAATGCILRNGRVVDFNSGVLAGTVCRIEDLLVRSVSGTAISAGDRSHVLGNTVEGGVTGISAGADAYVANNAVMNVGTAIALGSGSSAHGNAISGAGTSFTGARTVGTNLCDGDPCAAPPLRRFYLTQQTFDGAQAPNACAEGFHMASLWEIKETSSLRYDTDLGQYADDAGEGPPVFSGWVRTGRISYSSGDAGWANCSSYTTASAGAEGTMVSTDLRWDHALAELDPIFYTRLASSWGWAPATLTCDSLLRVWCVQD